MDEHLCLQDWDAIAKKDNLNDMSTELRRLEAMVKEIHQEMLFLRSREEEMRNINGVHSLMFMTWQRWHMRIACLHVCRSIHGASDSDAIDAEATNARVAWFSIGSLFVCIFLAAWQLWYLKVGDFVLQRSLRITLFTQTDVWKIRLFRDSVRMLHAALLFEEEATVTLDFAPWGVEEVLMLLSGGRTTSMMKHVSSSRLVALLYRANYAERRDAKPRKASPNVK